MVDILVEEGMLVEITEYDEHGEAIGWLMTRLRQGSLSPESLSGFPPYFLSVRLGRLLETLPVDEALRALVEEQETSRVEVHVPSKASDLK